MKEKLIYLGLVIVAITVLVYFVYMIVMIGAELRTSIISTLQP